LPLALGRPWSGELVVSTADNEVSGTLAALVADRMSAHLEAHRLRQVDQARNAWLAYLADVDTMLGHSLDRALTAALIPRLVVPRIGQWCALHLAGKDGALSLAAATHVDESRNHPLSTALESGATLQSLSRLPTTRGASPVVIDGWLEGYAIPLTARDQLVGVITAGGHGGRQSAEDAAMLEEIARRAALALDNARIYVERQQIAHVLQRSLLPPLLPVVAGIDLAAEYSPTDEQIDVGGDFYDVMQMSDGRWLLVVGDVSGKGVEAAVVTGLVRDVLRALVGDGRPVLHVLSVLNRTLAARAGGLYCTLVLAILERDLDGQLRVVLHLAGHDRAVLISRGQGANFVGSLGTVLGLLETIRCPATEIRLMADEALVLYTDGVTERRNGRELFGLVRLQETLAPLAGYPASVVATQLKNTAIAFSPTRPQDDIAILVIRNESR
ncbi:MAG: PP2C family protein-serine/threonine phosphatase, partial [Micromonosporaceae bacterium]